nr:allantoinase AllB [uncultured Oscillibacter sp.]
MGKKLVFQGGAVVLPDEVVKGCLVVEDGQIAGMTLRPPKGGYDEIDVSGKILLPGGVDSHVHVTEPSPNSRRENWTTASRSAAAGGVTTIVQMPVNDPPVDGKGNFELVKKLAEQKSCVDFALWGALIPSSVPRLEELNRLGCVAYKGFMSNGCSFFPRIDDVSLVKAMTLAREFGGLIGLHAEHAELAEAGVMELDAARCSDYARYDEARPWWVEAEAIQRALLFARVSGARLYIAHLSAAEGVKLVREAKQRGQCVVGETCPHYLLFTKDAFREKGGYAKCNPPLRSKENQERLWEYIFDGTLDVLGSDHGVYRDAEEAPEENFWTGAAGFPSIDVALTAFYSEAVVERGLPLPMAAALAAGNAARIFGLADKGSLLPGKDADIVVMDFHSAWRYDAGRSFSGTKFTRGLYQDRLIKCRVEGTYVRGERVYDGETVTALPGYGRFTASRRQRGEGSA